MDDNFAKSILGKVLNEPTPKSDNAIPDSLLWLFNALFPHLKANPDGSNVSQHIDILIALHNLDKDAMDGATRSRYEFYMVYSLAVYKRSEDYQTAVKFDEYKLYDEYLAAALSAFTNHPDGQVTQHDIDLLHELATIATMSAARQFGTAAAKKDRHASMLRTAAATLAAKLKPKT